MTIEKHGAFDIWHCIKCDTRFEKNIKVQIPKCPKCNSRRLSYIGQVAR